MEHMGRLLIFLGLVIVVTGGLLVLLSRVSPLGRLPGDIRLEGSNWSCWVPLGTSILLSLLLTVLLNLALRLLRR